jgi:hypothetical protein
VAEILTRASRLNGLFRKNDMPSRSRPGIAVQMKETDLFGLGLFQTETAATFLPLAALLEEVDSLETLEDVALGCDLSGTFKRCVLAHFLLFLSTGEYYITF